MPPSPQEYRALAPEGLISDAQIDFINQLSVLGTKYSVLFLIIPPRGDWKSSPHTKRLFGYLQSRRGLLPLVLRAFHHADRLAHQVEIKAALFGNLLRALVVLPTPETIAALGEEKLAAYIQTIGLFRTKARNVIAMTRLLLDRHGGEVPHDLAELEALPGVGRKTANVILNIVFGEPTIAVDTHIFRLANRTGLAPGKDVGTVEAKLLESVPAEYRQHAHHWLILHGRYVCKARKPECYRCLIRDLCAYPDKTPAP